MVQGRNSHLWPGSHLWEEPPNSSLTLMSTQGPISGKQSLLALCPHSQAREGWDTLQWRLALSLAAVQTTPPTPSLPGLGHEARRGGTDSKCPPTPQVRRGHPTVHSETKYVELIVINDHQLVSPQTGG